MCVLHSKKLDFETFFRGQGAFHDHCSGEAWKKEKVVEAVRNDFHEMDSFSVMQWRRRSENLVGETVISTKLFAKLKDEGVVRSRMVARQLIRRATEDSLRCTTSASRSSTLGLVALSGLNRETARYGMLESSMAFQDEVNNMFFCAWSWHVLKTVPCLAYHPTLDCLCVFNGDEFYTDGEPEVLDQVDPGMDVFHELVHWIRQRARSTRRNLLLWSETGYLPQGDGKHHEALAELLKTAPTPMTRATVNGAHGALVVLAKAAAVMFRRSADIAMYIGPD